MKPVGIFGGTFDPIHLGHLIAAQSVKEIRNLEKIIFIPSFISPFKAGKKISESNHRLKMLKLAIKDIPYFDFSDIEIKAKKISFTVDTLEILSKKYKNIELIIGMDNLLDFHLWKDPGRILELSKLIVLRRKFGMYYAQEKKYNFKKNKFYRSAIFAETPLIDISGKEIRRRVKNNLPINFLVPKNVKEYIYKFNLYSAKLKEKL